jgi:hypothetical protein
LTYGRGKYHETRSEIFIRWLHFISTPVDWVESSTKKNDLIGSNDLLVVGIVCRPDSHPDCPGDLDEGFPNIEISVDWLAPENRSVRLDIENLETNQSGS